MFPTVATVDVSRIQFAATALFHFLFVPLTLGMAWLLVIMEAAYLKTGKQVYKDMVKFWGKLFAINFAMGVVTGITMEFEFGLNWAYFSRFIGDTFGSALAIEGITAFMTEATMFGLFFFTWDKVGKKTHFLITTVMAIGTNLSIVNILVANSWMQHPLASYLDYHTMTMHLTSFVHLYMASLAQIRIGHVAFGGFIISATFMLGISSYYLLKGRDIGFAMRSFAVAAGFGFCAAIFVFFLGDANGLAVAKNEPTKMAAIEGQWITQKAPAAWYPIAFPSQSQEKNYGVFIQVPYMLSLIASHNLTGTVEGLKPIMKQNLVRLHDGAEAYAAMVALREGKGTAADQATFDRYRDDIGYGMLLTEYAKNPLDATPAQITRADKATIPLVWVVFWSFRAMLFCWAIVFWVMFFAFAMAVHKKDLLKRRFLLRCALYSIPLPYLAAEFGWLLAEMGRQPWTVHGILPTLFSASSLHLETVVFSLSGFVVFYTILFCVELYLMFKYGRQGPSTLGTGRYHFETANK